MFSLYTCVSIALVIIYISSHNVLSQNISSLSSTHEKLKRAIMKTSASKGSGECATVSAKIVFPGVGNL